MSCCLSGAKPPCLLIGIKQIAQYLGISEGLAFLLISKAGLPTVRGKGRTHVAVSSIVDKWLEERLIEQGVRECIRNQDVVEYLRIRATLKEQQRGRLQAATTFGA
jgi:predicted DNA-binding transcriptional regulator AlpA